MLYALMLAIGLAWLLTTPTASAETESGADAGSTGMMLAAKGKKKGNSHKKPKKDEDDGFGVEGMEAVTDDNGVGIHREQEGVDTPYKAEAAMSVNLSFLSNQVGDADATNNTTIDINVEWLAILGSIAIGPDIGYQSVTDSSTVTTVDSAGKPTTKEVENKDTQYRVGGLFKFYFANIDHADLVPFAYAGVASLGTESKAGEADAVKASGFGFRVGGGLNLFLDSNIAFNPRLEYVMQTTKTDGENSVEVKEGGLKILVGIAVFI